MSREVGQVVGGGFALVMGIYAVLLVLQAVSFVGGIISTVRELTTGGDP